MKGDKPRILALSFSAAIFQPPNRGPYGDHEWGMVKNNEVSSIEWAWDGGVPIVPPLFVAPWKPEMLTVW